MAAAAYGPSMVLARVSERSENCLFHGTASQPNITVFNFADWTSLSPTTNPERHFHLLPSSRGQALDSGKKVQDLLRHLGARLNADPLFRGCEQHLHTPLFAIGIQSSKQSPQELLEIKNGLISSAPALSLGDCVTIKMGVDSGSSEQAKEDCHGLGNFVARLTAYPLAEMASQIPKNLDESIGLKPLSEFRHQLLKTCFATFVALGDVSAALALLLENPHYFPHEPYLHLVARMKLQRDGFDGFEQWLSDILHYPQKILWLKAPSYLIDAIDILRQQGNIPRCLMLLEKAFAYKKFDNADYIKLRCFAGQIIRLKKHSFQVDDLIILERLCNLDSAIPIQTLFRCGCLIATPEVRSEALQRSEFSPQAKECLKQLQEDSALPRDEKYSPGDAFYGPNIMKEFFCICLDVSPDKKKETLEGLKKEIGDRQFKRGMEDLIFADLGTAVTLAPYLQGETLIEFFQALSKYLGSTYRVSYDDNVPGIYKHGFYFHTQEEIQKTADLLLSVSQESIARILGESVNRSCWSEITKWVVHGLLPTNPRTVLNMCDCVAEEDRSKLVGVIVEHVTSIGDETELEAVVAKINDRADKLFSTLSPKSKDEILCLIATAYARIGCSEKSLEIIPLLTDKERQDPLRSEIAVIMHVHGSKETCDRVIGETGDQHFRNSYYQLGGSLSLVRGDYDGGMRIYQNHTRPAAPLSDAYHIAMGQYNSPLFERANPKLHTHSILLDLDRIKTQICSHVKQQEFELAETVAQDLFQRIPKEDQQNCRGSVNFSTRHIQFVYSTYLQFLAQELLKASKESRLLGDHVKSQALLEKASRAIFEFKVGWNPTEKSVRDKAPGATSDSAVEWKSIENSLRNYENLIWQYLETNDSDSAIDAYRRMERLYGFKHCLVCAERLADYFTNRGQISCALLYIFSLYKHANTTHAIDLKRKAKNLLEYLLRGKLQEIAAFEYHLLLPIVTPLLEFGFNHLQDGTRSFEDLCMAFGELLGNASSDFDIEAFLTSLKENQELKHKLLGSSTLSSQHFSDDAWLSDDDAGDNSNTFYRSLEWIQNGFQNTRSLA